MAADGKRVFIKSYGCQMNVYDSRRMADVLAPEGYSETDTPENADLVVLNTCHIREKAADKVYSELGRLRILKQARAEAGQDTAIVVAGCVAQAEGGEIHRRSEVVDLVVGPQSYHRLPDLLARARSRKTVETEFPVDDKFDHLPAPAPHIIRARGLSAFVTVQEGCDKFCAFCVVPYTRGSEFSRPVAKILEEVSRLASAGVREITLVGQNVNAYHGLDERGAPQTLSGLIARVADVPGIVRVRYTTSHPNDMDDALIAAHAHVPALMPYLHLPVQSGSNRVLAAMNRRHTVEAYHRIIEKVRHVRPDIAVSSDFIVGFPGETDADFEETLRLVDEIGFVNAYTFKYSERPGTPASDRTDQVCEEVKAERLACLQARLDIQRHASLESMVGCTVEVLLERNGRKAGQLAGKSPTLHAVQIDAEGTGASLGDIVPVTIVSLGTNSLFGTLATAHPTAAHPTASAA